MLKIILFALIPILSSIIMYNTSYVDVLAISLEDIKWKNYTSERLGFSIEYPDDPTTTLTGDSEPTRFDPVKDPTMEVNSDLGNFELTITSHNESSSGEELLPVLMKATIGFMLMDDPSSPTYYKLVEDISPLKIDGNNGSTVLLSNINKDTETVESVLNMTNTNYGGKDYTFHFTSEPQNYDENEKIFNHMLNSIKFLK
jgi:hypothetical protein